MTSERQPDEGAGAASTPVLRADAERNRQLLLAAAEEVFAERGLDATLDDIAAHAGVGVGTAYRRFGNKQHVIEAIFDVRVTEMLELAEACTQMVDAGEGLTRFLEEICDALTANRGFRDVLLRAQTGRTNVMSVRERLLPFLVTLVDRAQDAGAVRADFSPLDLPMVILMMESVADATDRLDAQLWRRYLSLLMDGMRPQTEAHLPSEPLSSENIEQAMLNRTRR